MIIVTDIVPCTNDFGFFPPDISQLQSENQFSVRSLSQWIILTFNENNGTLCPFCLLFGEDKVSYQTEKS